VRIKSKLNQNHFQSSGKATAFNYHTELDRIAVRTKRCFFLEQWLLTFLSGSAKSSKTQIEHRHVSIVALFYQLYVFICIIRF
jgi:hypothetical protein